MISISSSFRSWRGQIPAVTPHYYCCYFVVPTASLHMLFIIYELGNYIYQNKWSRDHSTLYLQQEGNFWNLNLPIWKMFSVNSREILWTINDVQIELITGIKDKNLHLMVIFQKQKCSFYTFYHLSSPSPHQSSLVSQRLLWQQEVAQSLQRILNNVMLQYGMCE